MDEAGPGLVLFLKKKYKKKLITGAFLYAPYSFLLISNKFWIGGRCYFTALEGAGGGRAAYRLDAISQGPKNS